jgi:hypothetical protein
MLDTRLDSTVSARRAGFSILVKTDDGQDEGQADFRGFMKIFVFFQFNDILLQG